MKQDYPSYQTDAVEIIEHKYNYNGFFKVSAYKLRHKLFNGAWSEEIQRELFERGHACVMLPYDPIRDEIVLIEQFRIGALERPQSPWVLELIAGVVEDGESFEEVVRREAEEEANLSVSSCQRICSYLPSSGGCSERIELFVGEIDSSNAGGIYGLAEEGEDIKVHVVSRLRAFELLEQGLLDNAASIIALQWLMLNGESLRKAWLNKE